MKCKICNSSELSYDNNISCKCRVCGILYNLQTKELDYSNGGGQDIPTKEKSKIRILNSLKRFEIINPYIKEHNIFIDIGCGSGEMLEASKQYFDKQIGYDENKVLIEYVKKKSLLALNKCFAIKDIEDLRINNDGIVLTLNHVLEHVETPLQMLENVFSNLFIGDIIYIEVPLYTGYSFRKKKYDWTLWYDEHLSLYSLETLIYIANKLDMQILDKGYRNFISDNYSKKMIIKQFINNPINFIFKLFTKKRYQLILDNVIRDYGFVVLKK